MICTTHSTRNIMIHKDCMTGAQRVLTLSHVTTMTSTGSEEIILGFAPNISKNMQNVNVLEEDNMQ